MTGKKAKARSLTNCRILVNYLRKHGESGTRAIKNNTTLTALNSANLWTFNQILIDRKASFRFSTRTAGTNQELQWSIRKKKYGKN